MPEFAETDERVIFAKQLEEDTGPIILIDTFHVKPEEVSQFLEACIF